MRNLIESISARARELPDAPAVLTAESSLSYAELDRAVTWTAGTLQEAGVERGDVVAIRLSNRTQHLMTSLALARLGAGQIAFLSAGPAPSEAILLGRLGITASVADESTEAESRIPPPPDRLDEYKDLPLVDLPAVVDGDLPCLLTTSSGTTGDPKVGLLTQAVAGARLQNYGHGLPHGPGTRFLSMPNPAFLGAKFHVLYCLMTGGCLVLIDDSSSTESVAELVSAHRVSYLAGGPVHAHAFLRLAKDGEILFPGLEALRMSSTLVPDALRLEIRDRLTPNLYVGFGSSEIGCITVAAPDLVGEIPSVVGELVPGFEAAVVGENDELLPPGEAGLLRLKSPGMIHGYLDDPEESACAFRDGWFLTGDRAAHTPDGALIHFGRADDLMIVDGVNIHPIEIENAMLQHPAIAEVAVFSVEDAVRGDFPVAAIVTHSPISGDDLISHCEVRLGLKSPAAIVPISELPRNAAGKVLKNVLADRYRRRYRG